MGAMHVLDSMLADAPTILTRAFETTSHFVHGCGGEMELLQVASALGSGSETETATRRPAVPVVKHFAQVAAQPASAQ